MRAEIQIVAGRRVRQFVAIMLAGTLSFLSPGLSAQAPTDTVETENTAQQTAPVVVDGRQLFVLRGITSFPAKTRAAQVRSRIVEVARDPSFSVDDLEVRAEDDHSAIYAGDTRLVVLFDGDAEVEQIQRTLLAEIVRAKIADGITRFRTDRSPRVLLTNSVYALGLTAVVLLILWGTLRLFRWLDSVAVRHVGKGAKGLASKSHQLIKAKQIWSLAAGLLRSLRFITMAIVLYFYLNTLLGLYPWTRPAALVLFDLVLNPIESLWFGFLAALPDLFFLLILYFVVRYILRLMRTFFRGVETGRITLTNFDSDWAMPTYKILRLLTIAFSVVIAYPYIPGSDSAAFKGVSLFLGVIFSLGSSSFISNMMAGMAMTYRSAFKDGDIIRVGDVMGRVVETKLMITRVITVKNESIVIPNSNILNSNVINYSVLAREQGLVIHSTVGIGYDAPWRQVEAMLLMAADRTNGLKKDPPPFVLQLSMGDFTVNYQINGFCEDEARMLAIKSDLHRNIQDVFNEHGVQIMSPNYENDPETPKVVPPDQWYAAPAVKPE
jgi:small-conductance mechanosensitive channel